MHHPKDQQHTIPHYHLAIKNQLIGEKNKTRDPNTRNEDAKLPRHFKNEEKNEDPGGKRSPFFRRGREKRAQSWQKKEEKSIIGFLPSQCLGVETRSTPQHSKKRSLFPPNNNNWMNP